MSPTAISHLANDRLEHLLGRERLGVCVHACDGSIDRAVALYRWNATVSAALWEPLAHLEVALRNAMSNCLDERHRRAGRVGSWLDDTDHELDGRVRRHVAVARRRVRQKGKVPSDAQTISELGFGFWRYLVTRRHTALWPDLASAFPRTTLVLNHTGLPADRSDEGLAGWRAAMRALADCPNACVKISGLGIRGRPWRARDQAGVVLDAIAIFGASRCMFASNFPVDGLVGSYATIMNGFREIVADLPAAGQRALFWENAHRVYRIGGA